MNSVLKGSRQRRLDDINLEIWCTTFSNCESEVETELREKDMKS